MSVQHHCINLLKGVNVGKARLGQGAVCSVIALSALLCFAGQLWDEAVEKEVVRACGLLLVLL